MPEHGSSEYAGGWTAREGEHGHGQGVGASGRVGDAEAGGRVPDHIRTWEMARRSFGFSFELAQGKAQDVLLVGGATSEIPRLADEGAVVRIRLAPAGPR